MSPVEFALAFSTGLVCTTLAVSGIAKLRRTDKTLRALNALDLPIALRTRSLARALPIAELLLAGALLLSAGVFRAAAGIAATMLFSMFTALLVRVLVRGESVDCGCFGGASSDGRVSAWALARNGALILCAFVIATTDGTRESFVAELARTPPQQLVLLGLAGTFALLMVLAREIVVLRKLLQEASARPPGLSEEGNTVPDIELVDRTGLTLPLRMLGRGRPVLLVFASAECSSCREVGSAIAGWAEQLSPIQVRLVTSSRPGEVARRFPGAEPYSLYGARAIRRSLNVERSPAAIVLGDSGRGDLTSQIAYGTSEIEALVETLRPAARAQ